MGMDGLHLSTSITKWDRSSQRVQPGTIESIGEGSMKKTLTLIMFALVIAAMLVSASVSAQQTQPQTQLPPRTQTTVQDLKDQIADCAIGLKAETKYEAALIDRISDLEKQLAAFKSANTKPA